MQACLIVALPACSRAASEGTADTTRAAALDTATVRRAVDSVAESMTAALLRQDMGGVAAGLAEDYVSLETPGQIVRGRAAYRTAIDEMAKAGTWSELAFRPEGLDVAGDLAVRYGRWRMTYVPAKGDTMRADGNFVHVWRRQGDGAWRLAREINNSATAAPQIPAVGVAR
ncbi:hypothetical protein rosag_33530 [Roseisolibacter agri]|uniref:DUF4440 domain-containing protein n=2 Tax=Roseisolibacter agri TaxID=2014610 RepID=A0AA37Q593_9BACT|nr:hypothetical protein rosag_33530 [Roseisolibacter agri]